MVNDSEDVAGQEAWSKRGRHKRESAGFR